MEKIIETLKGWIGDKERQLGQLNFQIKDFQKQIIDRDLKRLDVERDIKELRKAIVLLEAHKGAIVL